MNLLEQLLSAGGQFGGGAAACCNFTSVGNGHIVYGLDFIGVFYLVLIDKFLNMGLAYHQKIIHQRWNNPDTIHIVGFAGTVRISGGADVGTVQDQHIKFRVLWQGQCSAFKYPWQPHRQSG